MVIRRPIGKEVAVEELSVACSECRLSKIKQVRILLRSGFSHRLASGNSVSRKPEITVIVQGTASPYP